MAQPLIGLLGRKQSGKDTFARFLVEEHGFTRLAFADPLKDAALATDPWISVEGDEVGPLCEGGPFRITLGAYRLRFLVDHFGWDATKGLREARRYLQNFGVGIRALDLDFWARVALDQAHKIPGPVVVTDVRFPNEADEIEASGGRLIRIVRPNRPEDDGDLHESETALLDRVVHDVVMNVGGIDDLGASAARLARRVLS